MEQTSPQQRPATRPRSKSSFSLRSGKSEKSTSSSPFGKPKIKVKLGGGESESDKRRKRLSDKSYADPSKAINEVQPAARNMLEGSTLMPLRDFQHKDVYGNPISDPDASNPTRSRIERPLDTIRSFEAAIDAGYTRRNPMPRSETAPELVRQADLSSRRSSYADDEGMGGHRSGPRGSYGGPSAYNGHGQNSHYRPSPLRQNQDRYSYGPSAYTPHNRPQRTPSASLQQRGHSDFGMYSHHNYHDSYDTMQTGDSGGSSEPWANSTGPSSENSSVDRMQQQQQQQQPRLSSDAYAVNYGGNHGPVSPIDDSIPEEFGPYNDANYGGPQARRAATPGSMNGMNGMNQAGYPHPPPHMAEQPSRNIIRLGDPQAPSQPPPQPTYPRQAYPQPPAHSSYPQPQSQGEWHPRPNQGGPFPPQRMPSDRPPPPSKDRRSFGQPGGKLQRQQRGPAAPPPPVKEKRKSWLKRLF